MGVLSLQYYLIRFPNLDESFLVISPPTQIKIPLESDQLVLKKIDVVSTKGLESFELIPELRLLAVRKIPYLA
jgi:hypothetical protein